jgi:hypothetical protein
VTTVVAVDLDRTLIYSAAAIASAGTDAGRPRPQLICVERLDDRPLSFMTGPAAGWLEQVREHAVLVPTTTRTLEQYARVRLPGGTPAFAVTSNGGHIVVDGAADQDWRRAVDATIAGSGAPLAEVVQGLARQAVGPWVRNRRVADDLFCYLVVDLAELPGDFVPTWTAWCARRGWVVSVQGRKIYALPRELTKEAAVTEVLDRTRARRLLAAGDGALDAGFLTLADAAIRPAHGELADTGWRRPHVRVTSETGVLAGEEISRWLAVQVSEAVER